MKNIPKKIYLQIDADGETPEDFNGLNGISWCVDKINDNDIEYRLVESPSEEGKEKQDTFNVMFERGLEWERKYKELESRLQELEKSEKQWISVKDKLPFEQMELLLCEDNGDYHLGMLLKANGYPLQWCLNSGGYKKLEEIEFYQFIVPPKS